MQPAPDKILQIKLEGPVLTELDWELLQPRALLAYSGVQFDCSGVRIMSSMVLARLMEIGEIAAPELQIRFINLEPELRNLLLRTGLQHWLEDA